ncbi:MAG: hypothetical protein VZR27_03645 [Acutalibacteraceae bacterium]|nr:hypothetical protein [Clostridia bacterium]MEE3449783.1 hypothetical protein [Acutalibacteraceae bacterium]
MNLLVRFLPEFAEDIKSFSPHDRSIIKAAVTKLIDSPFDNEQSRYGKLAFSTSNGSIYTAKVFFTDIRIVYKIMHAKDKTLMIFAAVTSDTNSLS